MADKEPKQEEASETTPAVVAEDAGVASAGTQGEDKATASKAPGDGKKKEKKGNKDGKGKGGGKGKSQGPSGPFGHGDTGFRLNVKNLGADVTTEKLRALFEPCGKVTEAEVKVREDGKSRGFGFVIFSSEEEAKKAIADMNGNDVDGKGLSVGPAERRPLEAGEEGKGKGKGKDGKGKKGGADAFQYAQMQAVLYQQQMVAMQQWYAYMGAMGTQAAPAGGATVAAPAAAAPVNPEYEGSLKSISARNGYGFIVCAATWARYERDVYVDKEVLPEGAKPPDRLIFTVTLNAKGHPKAATCKLAV